MTRFDLQHDIQSTNERRKKVSRYSFMTAAAVISLIMSTHSPHCCCLTLELSVPIQAQISQRVEKCVLTFFPF